MNIPNPFDATVLKLNSLAADLRMAAMQNQYSPVLKRVDELRQYSGCFYCVAYRRDLEKNYPGVCNTCPCHKLGEKTLERSRSYNGCYVRGPYREMVRLAWWFRTNPDASTAKSLAFACEDVVRDMYANEGILRG